MFRHTHAHAHGGHEHIPGITEDTILRPAGWVLFFFGVIWAMFAHIAVTEGTYDVPKAAGALIVAGLLMAAFGKKEEQI